uniref:Glycosyl hydrolase family 3 N terminal domain-containing protein n=1 Tax=uncultured bacterium contig00003(2014) TaxID=1465624 RepID=A0A060D199_9BACT|nr:glycosyl hydrolase family 3 N terminal domain-containing protein [uncultured bacterium contig00003(2014)]
MTLDEKAKLLTGTGMEGFSGDIAVVGETNGLVPGAAGTTCPIPRLGIPSIVLGDGPAGLRIHPTRDGDTATYYCTAFPVGTLLASTWNPELVERVGEAMGNEALEYGVDVLLTPALNIQRNPLCGRNYEYYSEDPVVSGKMASAIIRGVQANGVGASPKHFAANNQETNRMASDSRLTQRALREIYLRGFEIVVRESQPLTIMTSYNLIDGVYSSESRDLLTTVLRDEWGFGGMVMTDWFGGKDAAAQIRAGNDLMMPGLPAQHDSIVAAVNNGSLAIEDVDVSVKRILNLVLASPRFKGYAFSNKPDLEAHARIARQSAAEGMVLLENRGALPFSAAVKNIVAFGITSYDFIAGGTGSGDVNEAYTVSLKEGLTNAGYNLDADMAASYEKYIASENEKIKPDTINPLAAAMPKVRMSEPVPARAEIARLATRSDIALVTIGRSSGEFADRRLKEGDFLLSAAERNLIESVCREFHAAGKQVVVVLNIGGVIETASWKDLPDAVLLAWQAGQEGGNSVADVLKGAVNPSGKLPMTFPVDYMDASSSANFPYDYQASVSTPALLPGNNTKTKTELVRNVDYTDYEEDIYVGYRWLDTRGKAVSYPFGYGLSYTSFEYSAARLSKTGGVFTVSVNVTNSGAVGGKEVVQLYASAPPSTLGKPAQELKGFAKTQELKPGESQTVTITVAESDLASFDEARSAWVTDAGTYKFRLSSSSRNVRATLDAVVERASEIKTHNVLNPREPLTLLNP